MGQELDALQFEYLVIYPLAALPQLLPLGPSL